MDILAPKFINWNYLVISESDEKYATENILDARNVKVAINNNKQNMW